MTKKRNPRRAYDADGNEIEPMSLARYARARGPLRVGVLRHDRLRTADA